MLIFENSNLEIHDVGSSTDPTLTPIEVTDGTFDGWSVAKICCYRAQVVDGNVVMLTPYVDSRLIAHIYQLGSQGDQNASDMTDAQEAIAETYDSVEVNAADITDAQEAIAELYELIMGGE